MRYVYFSGTWFSDSYGSKTSESLAFGNDYKVRGIFYNYTNDLTVI